MTHSTYTIQRAKRLNGSNSPIIALLRDQTLLAWQDHRDWQPATLANYYHSLALGDIVARQLRGEE